MDSFSLIESSNNAGKKTFYSRCCVVLALLSLAISFVAIAIVIKVDSQNWKLQKQVTTLMLNENKQKSSMALYSSDRDQSLVHLKILMMTNQKMIFNNLTKHMAEELKNLSRIYEERISKLSLMQLGLESNISSMALSIRVLQNNASSLSATAGRIYQRLNNINTSLTELHNGLTAFDVKENNTRQRVKNVTDLLTILQNKTFLTNYSTETLKNKTTNLLSALNEVKTRLCQRNGVVFENKCFQLAYLWGPPVNYSEAAKICKQQNGNLAEVKTNKTLKLLANMIRLTWIGDSSYWTKKWVEIWLGLKYENETLILENGDRSNVTLWYPGYPTKRSNYTRISLYVGIDPDTLNKTGIYNNKPDDPYHVPLCSYPLKDSY